MAAQLALAAFPAAFQARLGFACPSVQLDLVLAPSPTLKGTINNLAVLQETEQQIDGTCVSMPKKPLTPLWVPSLRAWQCPGSEGRLGAPGDVQGLSGCV